MRKATMSYEEIRYIHGLPKDGQERLVLHRGYTSTFLQPIKGSSRIKFPTPMEQAAILANQIILEANKLGREGKMITDLYITQSRCPTGNFDEDYFELAVDILDGLDYQI
jgi:hypothetical protein